MKRNLDTVRRLLEIFEQIPAGQSVQTFSGKFDNTPVEIVEHIQLMIEAGLVDGEADPDAADETGGLFFVRKLTWQGHDFINAARNEDVWNATKRRLSKVGAWTFALVVEVLKDEAKRRIGL